MQACPCVERLDISTADEGGKNEARRVGSVCVCVWWGKGATHKAIRRASVVCRNTCSPALKNISASVDLLYRAGRDGGREEKVEKKGGKLHDGQSVPTRGTFDGDEQCLTCRIGSGEIRITE